ncbi:prepilin peptidase [Candidatus Woesearchaeota archaeon]|nr:prepilin peptidase [Candidatus Woesearchaeota archaeon]
MLLLILCFVVLLIGSIEDIKKREIADYLNFFLLLSALVIRFFASFFSFSWSFFFEGIFGFLIFFLFSILLYYTGQWGGGDSKMLLGLGASIGASLPKSFDILSLKDFFLTEPLFKFFILIFLVGAIYATIWTCVVAVLQWKRVFEKIKIAFSSKLFSYIRYAFIVVFLLGSIFSISQNFIFRFLFFSFSGVFILMYGLILLLKGVEGTAMIKSVKVSDLTEGDWVVEDVFFGTKKICGSDDLGLELKQIESLKKHGIKEVKVKQGIPFVPSFFVAFLILIFNLV